MSNHEGISFLVCVRKTKMPQFKREWKTYDQVSSPPTHLFSIIISNFKVLILDEDILSTESQTYELLKMLQEVI